MEVKLYNDFFHLLIVVFIYNLDFCNCMCTKSKTFKKKDLSITNVTELSLWSKSGVESRLACGTHCGRDKECVSFFYNTRSGVCTAHTVQFNSTEPGTADEGYVYYTLLVGKRDCAEILQNDPDSPDGVYIIDPDDCKGPARVYCDMNQVGVGWTVVQDCAVILSNYPESPSGVYFINPADGVGHFRVYCDMTTDGGGWTVFQRRQDGSVDFNRYWDDYKAGFGQVDAEFWLGNDNINRLTSQRSYKLRVDMREQEDEGDQSGYATYSTFYVGKESDNYRLNVTGYDGNRENRLYWYHGRMFSTRLRDNDIWIDGDCAAWHKCGWWFAKCVTADLNTVYGNKLLWRKGDDKYVLKRVEMKLKPI